MKNIAKISPKAVSLIIDYANKNYVHMPKEEREAELKLFEYVGNLESRVTELEEMVVNSAQINYMYEDELPEDLSDEVYDVMFNCSKTDFVRLFPFVEVDGQKMFLVDLNEREDDRKEYET